MLALAALTWFTLDAGKNQAIVAYISVMITFGFLLVVITAHVYQYTSILTIFKKTWLFKQVLGKLQVIKKKQAQNVGKSKFGTSEQRSKSVEGRQEKSEPTFTVVEIRDCQVYSGNYIHTLDANCDHQ